MDQRSDEWDLFGQFVASEIRQIFDIVKRNVVKRSIMNVLFQSGSSEHTANGFSSETVYVDVEEEQ